MINEHSDSKPWGLCYAATYNWYKGSASLNGAKKSGTDQNCLRPWKQGRASEHRPCVQKLGVGEAGVRGHVPDKGSSRDTQRSTAAGPEARASEPRASAVQSVPDPGRGSPS